jgi:hypothetical protein
MKKHVVVSGSQEVFDKAGRNSEVGYQAGRRMQELKKEMEFAMFDNGIATGIGNAKVTGDDSTAREMATLSVYMTSNVSLGSGGAVATGDGTDVMTTGTDRPITEALLDAVLETTYNNGGNPKMLLVSATNKTAVSDFDPTGTTRNVSTDDKKLVTAIDVYVGDFHTLQVVPCRQLLGENAYAIDPEYLAMAEARGMEMKDLAKTGDSIRKEIVWEATLEVCNEAAHAMIADTDG